MARLPGMMKEREELDRIAMRLRMLSYRMGLKDARRLDEIAAELWDMVDRVPESLDATQIKRPTG
jgi:hypothetical protein